MWIFFLLTKTGSPWNKHQNVMIQAEISSDASEGCFAGIVDFVQGPTRITTGEFRDEFLN